MSMNISVAGIPPGAPCVSITLDLPRARMLQQLATTEEVPADVAGRNAMHALGSLATEAIIALQGMGAS